MESVKVSRMKTSAEYSTAFRAKKGPGYADYIRPYQIAYNAKPETKERRKARNAQYYQQKKAQALV